MNTPKFFFVLPPQERAMLEAVANHLERNKSDTLRWLIRQAATKGLLPAEQAQRFVPEPAGEVHHAQQAT